MTNLIFCYIRGRIWPIRENSRTKLMIHSHNN